MNIYKPIRDGPTNRNKFLVWNYLENLMPRQIRYGLVWMPSGHRETEIRGNDLSGSWHWQAVIEWGFCHRIAELRFAQREWTRIRRIKAERDHRLSANYAPSVGERRRVS